MIPWAFYSPLLSQCTVSLALLFHLFANRELLEGREQFCFVVPVPSIKADTEEGKEESRHGGKEGRHCSCSRMNTLFFHYWALVKATSNHLTHYEQQHPLTRWLQQVTDAICNGGIECN